MAKGNILGVVSAKGGVGKTTIVANLGVALTKEFKRTVLAVDGNITAPNLALYLEIVRPPVTIHDVLKDDIPISHAILTHSTGLDVVPGSIRELKSIDTSGINSAIRSVSENYDIVLLDSGPSVGEDVISVLETSDELLIVTVPEFLIVATTYKTINLAKKLGKPIRGIILNMIRGEKYEMSKDDVEECVGLPVIGMIREDNKIRESQNHGLSVVEQYPKSRSSNEFKTISAGLIGEEYISGFVAKAKQLLSVWRDLLFEKEEPKIAGWKKKSEDLWAHDIKKSVVEKKSKPKIVEPAPKVRTVPITAPEPVTEFEPELEPEPEIVPEPETLHKFPKYKVRKRIESLEIAIDKLRKNYVDGLMTEPVYKDLKEKYTDELVKLKNLS